ncbi:AHH domain-containing protein [Vibrio lentus]|uniref:AHH domain-containing protein n=1 Tax=Vibrio lentus TaxID=136468 RepID=UPI001E2D6E38|nr:AHH domain-containing protein [Vibrio lentus]
MAKNSTVKTHSLVKGSGPSLAKAIKSKHYKSGFDEHLWADGRLKADDGQFGLQAHHVITTKNLETPDWKKYRDAYEYNINTWKNGECSPLERILLVKSIHMYISLAMVEVWTSRLSKSSFGKQVQI